MNKVRASLGTLGVLGLELVQMDVPPTTAYLQIYTDKRCFANCKFCAQAAGSKADIIHIARGLYVPFDLEMVVQRLAMAYERGYLVRACIQTMLYDTWWQDTVYLIERIRKECSIPVSLSVFPLSDKRYEELKKLGINELVIPLDACTPELFNRIKGISAGSPFSWENHIDGMKRAAWVFGKVGTHLMLGLGENDEDAVRIISELWKNRINSALFSYTHIPGAQLAIEKNDENAIKHYRRVQLARHLILEGIAGIEGMKFENGILCDFGVKSDTIDRIIEEGEAFRTSGCVDCNRPMANETFSKIYNFPKKPGTKEIESVKKDFFKPQS